jgi:hypothetical protein
MAAALAVIAKVGEGFTALTLFESVMLMFRRDNAVFKSVAIITQLKGIAKKCLEFREV